MDSLLQGQRVHTVQRAKLIGQKMIENPVFDQTGFFAWMPPLLRASIEVASNYDSFRDKPIVPPLLEQAYKTEPARQTTPDVPEAYNWIGRRANVSPMKAQHFARGLVPRGLDDLARIGQGAMSGDFGVHQKADLPVVGRLFARDPIGFGSKSVQEVGAKAEQYKSALRRANELQSAEQANPEQADQVELSQVQATMQALAPYQQANLSILRLQRQISQLQKGTDPTKWEQIRGLQRQMTQVAQETRLKAGEEMPAVLRR